MKRMHCAMVRAGSSLKAHACAAGVALVWMAALAIPAWGQWTGGPSGPIYYNAGSVGVGTASPAAKLDVIGSLRAGGLGPGYALYLGTTGTASLFSNDGADYWMFSNAANTVRLTLANGYNWDNTMSIQYTPGTTGSGNGILQIGQLYRQTSGTFTHGITQLWTNGAERMRINAAGNVGIATTNPQYLLSVNGTIGTKDVIVTNTGWSDYVFRPGYRLRPLSEVNAFIRQHHRLPDIPTEAEVKEKGVSLGEMQSKLLAKVEELTLHMIQTDERSNRLEKQNRELRDRIARLEAGSAR